MISKNFNKKNPKTGRILLIGRLGFKVVDSCLFFTLSKI